MRDGTASSLWLQNVTVTTVSLTAHRWVDKPLRRFPHFSSADNAAADVGCGQPSDTAILSSLGTDPEVGLVGHVMVLFLNFRGTSRPSSAVSAPVCDPTDSDGGSFSCMSSPAIALSAQKRRLTPAKARNL